MRNSPLPSGKTEVSLSVSDLKRFTDGWILDCEYRQLSAATLAMRRGITCRLMWFLDHKQLSGCGTLELKQFLHYVANGHKEPKGRWDNPRLKMAVRPQTVRDFHRIISTFFYWMIAEGYLDANPMASIKPPIARADQIRPFEEQQISALLQASKASKHPQRDTAILLFMLDTGVRASELCELTFKDIDIAGKRAWVLGKGNKHRSVYFGRICSKALWSYLRHETRENDAPVFLTERGQAFSRNSLLQLFWRLGSTAKLG